MEDTLFLEKIKSEGLAHLSYLLGHGGRAAVIDPRRDCQIYVDLAYANGAQITHIFETHRNEDYVVGSMDLARRTGAQIFHGKALQFSYGNPVAEGDEFRFGNLCLTVLETPGHTDESISLVMRDAASGEKPLGVFTGDTLFIGSVGRTDFFPDRREEVAGLQYDSIFKKILPLGDHVILYPAHGAGSVCGSDMAEREISTLGYERMLNPALQIGSREAFIQRKIGEKPHQPRYFRKMEGYNRQGSAPPLERVPNPKPMGIQPFAEAMAQGMLAVDLRSPEAFAGAFVPGSLALPVDMIAAYGGDLLPDDQDLGLIADSYEAAQKAVRLLLRMGFDRVAGYLAGGLHGWETSGRAYDRIPAVHVSELSHRFKRNEPFTLLDVRRAEELRSQGRFPGSLHIFLGELAQRIHEIPDRLPVTTFCGSGKRAIIAASMLKRQGFAQVEDSLGSMAACRSVGCPIEQVT
jgi:hydroxyacylglutathione hydrolase